MRSIVVGVAAHGGPEPPLEVAIDEGVRRRLPVTAVHALGLPAFGGLVPGQPRPSERSRSAADSAVSDAVDRARVSVPGGVTARITVRLVDEDAVPALLREAGSAALLVVGTHVPPGSARVRLGSVSTGCLQRASAPVMVIPGTRAPHPTRVVVGVDGGACSLSALAWAVAQAQEHGLPLCVVGVCPESDVLPPALAALSSDPVQALRTLVHQAGGASLAAQVLVAVGDVTESLQAQVGLRDLLVLGSRGHGSLLSLLLGSTSTQLVNRACCPTVVVRSGQARRELHRSPVLRRLVAVRPLADRT